MTIEREEGQPTEGTAICATCKRYEDECICGETDSAGREVSFDVKELGDPDYDGPTDAERAVRDYNHPAR